MNSASPLVIAHRGASGHRPEHTEGAYRLAYRLGADSVELDLVPTRDGHLVCRHDLELSRTTDVAHHPELAGLRRTVEVEDEVLDGWFVHDLTLAQLKTLRCRERWPGKRPLSASYDGRWPVLTFAELLVLAEEESAVRQAQGGRPLGVHAEIKHPEFCESVGLSVPELVDGTDGVRDPRLTWMSFDSTVLRRLALRGVAGPEQMVQLFDGVPKGRHLSRAATCASGVGVRRKGVLPREDGRVGRPSGLVDKAARRGLGVLVWTHRAENVHLPRSLRIGPRDFAHGRAQEEAGLLYDAGIAGLITDFPELAVGARAGLRARQAEQAAQPTRVRRAA